MTQTYKRKASGSPINAERRDHQETSQFLDGATVFDIAAPGSPQNFQTIAGDRFAVTDPFLVNTIVPGRQESPAVAALSSGGFVAVWMMSQSVKLQLFDRHGEKVGSEFVVAAGASSSPAVVALAAGGFVVAWSDFENSEIDIWGRMFDAAGNPLAGQFLMSTESFGNPQQPSLAALSSGGFVATWTAQDVQFSSSGIKGQIFDALGARVGGEIGVNTTTAFEQYFSLTGALPGGGFVATWVDQLSGFRGQIFDASGSKVGAEFPVGGSNGDFTNALTVLSSGNFIVALVDGSGDISGQIFSPTGVPVGGPFRLNTVTDNNHDMPTLTALPDGGFVASWREATGTTNFFQDGEIKAQVFDANGVKIGDEFMVNVGTAGGQMIPKVVAFGSGDVGVLWEDFNGTVEGDIKIRLYFSALQGAEGADIFAGTSDRDFFDGRGGDDQISGGGGRDVLAGGEGNDGLDGGTGADDMSGGQGDDTYVVDHLGDVVVEYAGEGTDTIYAVSSYQLGAGSHVETLAARDNSLTTALALIGNELANTVSGNNGANFLDGGLGADILTGYGGDDIYAVDNAGDVVVEQAGGGNDTIYTTFSYQLGFGAAVEMLAARDNSLTVAMSLTGNELANVVSGNNGANFLDGGLGADILTGYGGDDIYAVDNAGDVVVEQAGGGNDIIYTTFSYQLGFGAAVEMLASRDNSLTVAMSLTGNELNNVILGNNGANFLDGNSGADVLAGYGGDDLYAVDNAGDQVFENAGGGNDSVSTTVSFTLGAGQAIEVLAARDNSSTTALNLTGNAFANTIFGNNGANVIDGGAGADALVGYGGADTFAFTTALGGGNVDTIHDFVAGTDKIALDDAIFTAIAGGSLSANAFVIGTAAADADDRIIYNSATGALLYDADGNGAGAAVQFASLSTGLALTVSDFQMI